MPGLEFAASRVVLLLACLALTATGSASEAAVRANDAFRVRSVRGKIVWLADALERLHGVESLPAAKQRIIALETDDHHLYPLVEDKRGRSFRLDPRLREGTVELLARQHRGSPMLQVIKIFSIDEDGKKFELDYWCEICAIAMFELKACDCCQGPIELRRTLVSEE